jgi:sugar phosphate isomerase/epimerase
MLEKVHRRGFLKLSGGALGVVAGLTARAGSATQETSIVHAESNSEKERRMRIGLVTYNLAKGWELETVIRNCEATQFEGVELRTTHAHKVEVSLSPKERADVKQRFADSAVTLCQLGSAFEFHSTDPAEVRRNIDGTKEYVKLAHDVGAAGVKVRPNGVQTKRGVPVEKTLEQIGKSLHECSAFAEDYGVQIRVEVHGGETSRLDYIQTMMEVADHSNVYVNWNSNQTDLEYGTLEENFRRVQDKITHVHMRDLFIEEYPWKKLFALLKGISYSGFCCAEIPESADPIRVMKYYRALFLAYQA